MESGDGGWIRAEAGGEPDSREEPRLDEDDGWPATVAGPSAGLGAGPGARPGAGRRWGHGDVPGFSAWVAAAAAVAASAAGVAVGFFLIRGAPSASAFTGAAPGVSAPPAVPVPVPVPVRAGQLRVALTGRVLAVSATSITIAGAGPSVTAAVTTGTRVTGRAHGVKGIKAGDHVAAQLAGTSAELTGTATHLTALAIQDLAGA
jgi:hypothetical protein